jgi:ankyrin repeat protein
MQAAGWLRSREEYAEELEARLAGIAFLLKNGAAERLDEAGQSALHAACAGPLLPREEIALLAGVGFDVNRRDAEGTTPMMLWLAAASDRLKDSNERERVLSALPQDAAFLLSLQADPALVDKRGRRAVDFLGKNARASLEERSPETLALLEKTAPPVATLLELCAAGCGEEAIRRALAGGLDIDPRDKEGDTPLHLAASRGDVETVKALLACGAPLGVANDARQSALGIAVLQREWSVFEALMAAGADINAPGYTTFWNDGRTIEMTPLAGAIYYGRKDDFAYLLRWKPDLEAKTRIYSDDDRTGTALHAAALLNASEMLERLLALGSRTEVGLSRMADTPLHLAARNGHVACVELLLRHGAKVDMYNTAWNTPLHLAAKEGRTACAALLLRHGAAVNARNSDEDTPLHFAAGIGNVQCVKLLLEHGADPTLKNMYNSTPAMRTEDPEIQKLLAP